MGWKWGGDGAEMGRRRARGRARGRARTCGGPTQLVELSEARVMHVAAHLLRVSVSGQGEGEGEGQ